MPDPIPHPLRVPVSDRWLYLRSGRGSGPKVYDRTVGCELFVACATADHAVVRVTGLPYWESAKPGAGLQEMSGELDAYLMSLGAEIVGPEEWPTNGDGEGFRQDRPPYRSEHMTIEDVRNARPKKG